MANDDRHRLGTDEAGDSLISHFEELRLRLFIAIGFWLVATIGAWFYAQPLLDWLMVPAQQAGAQFIVLGPQEALFTLFKLAVLLGVFVSVPVWLYQITAFAWPGLTRKERRAVLIGLPFVILLFLLGIAFAYFILLRYVFGFFLGFAGPEVTAALSLSAYVSFVIGLILPFGIIFQLPVLVAVCAFIGVITPHLLRASRKYALLVILLISAVLTPPDVVSQIAMSLPLYVLYEVSIWIAVLVQRRKEK